MCLTLDHETVSYLPRVGKMPFKRYDTVLLRDKRGEGENKLAKTVCPILRQTCFFCRKMYPVLLQLQSHRGALKAVYGWVSWTLDLIYNRFSIPGIFDENFRLGIQFPPLISIDIKHLFKFCAIPGFCLLYSRLFNSCR